MLKIFFILVFLLFNLSHAALSLSDEGLVEAFTLVENREELIPLLLTSGKELKKSGRWSEHIYFAEIALRRCEQEGRFEEMARISTQVASTYFYQGDFLSCTKKAETAYGIYAEKQDTIGKAASLYLLSAAERGLKNFDKSLSFAHAALALFQEGNCENDRLQVKLLFNLAAAYMDKEEAEPARAEAFLIPCILLAEKGEDQNYVLRASLRLAKAYLLLDKVEESQELLRTLSPHVKEPREGMHYHYLLAQLFLKKGLYVEALIHANKAKAQAEELHARQDLVRIAQLILKIDSASSL